MKSWTCYVAHYNTSKKFAQQQLSDKNGQVLIGNYLLKVLKICIKFLKSVENVTVTLNSNVSTAYLRNSEGEIKKQYSPLDMFVLNGSIGESKIFSTDFDFLSFEFSSEISEIRFWLQDLQRRKIDVEIDVFWCLSKS